MLWLDGALWAAVCAATVLGIWEIQGPVAALLADVALMLATLLDYMRRVRG